jgi:hypothetical protein
MYELKMLNEPPWMQPTAPKARLQIQGKTPKQSFAISKLPQGVFSETWDYIEREETRP